MWNIHLGSSWEIPMDFAMVFFWLVVEPTPPQNDGVKVSWGYDILNWMESHKSHVPNHQPVFLWRFGTWLFQLQEINPIVIGYPENLWDEKNAIVTRLCQLIMA